MNDLTQDQTPPVCAKCGRPLPPNWVLTKGRSGDLSRVPQVSFVCPHCNGRGTRDQGPQDGAKQVVGWRGAIPQVWCFDCRGMGTRGLTRGGR